MRIGSKLLFLLPYLILSKYFNMIYFKMDNFLIPQFQVSKYQQQFDLEAIPKNSYPARVGFIEKVSEYYPPARLAASLGVPTFTDQKIYNYILLGFWKCDDDATNAALVWSKPIDFFGDDSVFGKTKQQIQQNLHQKFRDNKSQVLVSAFGLGEMPASIGLNAQVCASKLAAFVEENNLDGCDIDWRDQVGLARGYGFQWLVSFQNQLRKLLPNHTITHTTEACYFRSEDYKNNSYTQFNSKVNKTINFYNIIYFNQGTSKYNTYDELFIQSTGAYPKTAVKELIDRGIDQKKIVVAKPVTPSDTTGSGWMDVTALGTAASEAYTHLKWFSGIGLWQYSSDVRGKSMVAAAANLKDLCNTNKDCK